MALRIHFPWGLLSTVLGFACLGGAAAYWLTTDVHGYLYRQCALQAIGAALLGAAAWVASERISYRVNLNTSPLLRLALSGVGAVFLAGELISPFTEFVAGTHGYWAEAAAVVTYFVAGFLPMLAVISMVAAAEASLSALRGDASLGAALRPVLPYALLGLVLAGVAGYSMAFLSHDVRTLVLTIVPDRLRDSAWLERRRTLFAEVLTGAGCEILVAPFDSAESTDARPLRSVDRPARALITRQVAARIAAYTGACVVDPTLVSRALGPRRRTNDWAAVTKLAEASGARTIVRGSLTLDARRQAYELEVQVFSRARGDKPRWIGEEGTQWGPFEFSDELPPEAAFQPLVAAVVERLGLPQGSAKRPVAVAPRSSAVPDSLGQLVEDPGSPGGRAQRLQLVAATYPRSDVEGDQLWERSVLAALAPPEDETARVARARAALHLYRRPYALSLLRGLASPEARAVHALAQGNLFEAQSLVPQMSDPVAALITQVELETMRYRYGRTAGYSERRDALLGKHSAYAPLLYVALSSDEWFQPASHDLIRRQLSALGVAIEEDAPIALVRLVAKQFGQELFFSSDSARLPAAIEKTCAPLWRARGGQWRTQVAADRLTEWDLVDALYAANREALINSGKSIGSRQKRPEAFLEFARGLGPSFAGYPPLVGSTAEVFGGMRYDRRSSPDVMLDQRQMRLLRDLIAWEGGETDLQRSVQWTLPPELAGIYADEPPRPWRPRPHPDAVWAEAGRQIDPAKLERNVVHDLRGLTFSQYSFEAVAATYALLVRSGHKEQAEQVAAQVRERFIGSPARDQFLMKQAEDKGDLPAYVVLLEQKIREQPEDWAAYYRLGAVQLQAGQPEQAQQTLLSYPMFRSDQANPVQLSNLAENGGTLMQRVGEGEAARPLYRLSAQYGTGSEAEMWSLFRLAQLDRDWNTVGKRGHQMYERYQEGWGLTYAAYASFLTGDQDQGWRDFYRASKQFEDMRPWFAAIAGHRIASSGDDEVLGFAKHWKSLSGRRDLEAGLRQHFIFNTLMLDRAPSDKAIAALDSVATGSNDPTFYRMLGTGYNAFKRGNYSLALEDLERISTMGVTKSESTKATVAHALPYFVASLVKVDRREEAQALLASFRDRVGKDFYYLLASAYLDGLSGATQPALDSLRRAQFQRPGMADVTVPPLFQQLETCEKLYELTHDERYRQLLLDLAVRQQKDWPWSWAYTFEAKYATDAAERERALGIALYLDPKSEHLAGFSAAQKKRAVEWFARNNPFKGKA